MAVIVMAGGEDLFDGHSGALPGGTPGPETLDGRPSGVSVLGPDRNQAGDRLAMTGDCNALAALHRAQELCEMSLGFGCLHTAHGEFN